MGKIHCPMAIGFLVGQICLTPLQARKPPSGITLALGSIVVHSRRGDRSRKKVLKLFGGRRLFGGSPIGGRPFRRGGSLMGGLLGADGSLRGAFFGVGSRIGRFFIARRFPYNHDWCRVS